MRERLIVKRREIRERRAVTPWIPKEKGCVSTHRVDAVEREERGTVHFAFSESRDNRSGCSWLACEKITEIDGNRENTEETILEWRGFGS